MELRSFLKSFSIYGMLPVLAKFANFFLLPIYTRVFSSYEFGIIELILSSMQFFIFAISLELYSGVGRYFFEKESLIQKRKLVSTGLWMTSIAAVIVVVLSLVFKNNIQFYLFDSYEYNYEYKLGVIVAVITAISTYLSVLPRYEKKAKEYVASNFISIIIRLASTIFFVLYLKLGIVGVLYGHIFGVTTSAILYYLLSKKYIRFVYSKIDMFEIAKYAIPFVPGLLAGALLKPIIRSMISDLYSMNELGLYSFALKIATAFVIIESGIRLSWRPILFENIKNRNFGKEYLKISNFAGVSLLFAGITLTLISKELIMILGTPEYYAAGSLVGFLLISKIVANLSLIRGFGFEVAKKTIYISIINIFSAGVTIFLLYTIARKFGLIGIVLVPLIPGVISYIIKIIYTKRYISLKTFNLRELILWGIMISVAILNIYNVDIIIRGIILVLTLAISFPYGYWLKNKYRISNYLLRKRDS